MIPRIEANPRPSFGHACPVGSQRPTQMPGRPPPGEQMKRHLLTSHATVFTGCAGQRVLRVHGVHPWGFSVLHLGVRKPNGGAGPRFRARRECEVFCNQVCFRVFSSRLRRTLCLPLIRARDLGLRYGKISVSQFLGMRAPTIRASIRCAGIAPVHQIDLDICWTWSSCTKQFYPRAGPIASFFGECYCTEPLAFGLVDKANLDPKGARFELGQSSRNRDPKKKTSLDAPRSNTRRKQA